MPIEWKITNIGRIAKVDRLKSYHSQGRKAHEMAAQWQVALARTLESRLLISTSTYLFRIEDKGENTEKYSS